jgi:Helix-turn-helix domain
MRRAMSSPRQRLSRGLSTPRRAPAGRAVYHQEQENHMSMPNDDDNLLQPTEAAEFLRVSKETLTGWRTQGAGPMFMRVGERIFYRTSALTAFQEKNSSTSEYGRPATDGEPA